MDSWFSPFALPPEVKDLLDRSNLRRIRGEQTEADDRRLLLVYRAPSAVLDHWQGTDGPPLRVAELQKNFEQLLQLRHRGPLVADWRLLGLDDEPLAQWLQGEPAPRTLAEIPRHSPLNDLVLLNLLRSHPELEMTYREIELQGELFGSEADTRLLERLSMPSDPDALLSHWCGGLRTSGGWDNPLERMQRLEQDLEHYLLLCREQQLLLEDQNALNARAVQLVAEGELPAPGSSG